MNIVWNSALALLVIAGLLLGVTLPLGKLAGEAGILPVVWAFLISAGAGTVLLFGLFAKGRGVRLDAGRLRYFFLAAALSYAAPNVLMFSTLPHLGAGYVGIMFTLSPMLTLLLSIMLGVRRPNALGIVGILVGFVGALIVALTRANFSDPSSLIWILAGLAIPLFLASGNVYRTLDWPRDANPIELAAGSHLASAVILFAVLVIMGDLPGIISLADVPLLSVLQVLAAATMFAFFFRLQAVGGPVYLSQIGYVGAAVGLFSGMLFLGETYQVLTWVGVAFIIVGVTLTTKAQSRTA